jgi:hypothetical protein
MVIDWVVETRVERVGANMVTSLSDLCARLSGTESLVLQGDRRQTPDRRRARRGGRRADDVNPSLDELDMRSVAIRRTLANSGLPVSDPDERSHSEARYRAMIPAEPTLRRLAVAGGQRTPK